jgi:hypothetical protein
VAEAAVMEVNHLVRQIGLIAQFQVMHRVVAVDLDGGPADRRPLTDSSIRVSFIG